MPNYSNQLTRLPLTVIPWQCQLLPGTISGANSHAGTEKGGGEGRARAIPPKSPKFKTGALISFACFSALGPSSSQTLSLAPQLQVVLCTGHSSCAKGLTLVPAPSGSSTALAPW